MSSNPKATESPPFAKTTDVAQRHARAETAFERSAFLLLGMTVVLAGTSAFSPSPGWLKVFVGAFALALAGFAIQGTRRGYWSRRLHGSRDVESLSTASTGRGTRLHAASGSPTAQASLKAGTKGLGSQPG